MRARAGRRYSCSVEEHKYGRHLAAAITMPADERRYIPCATHAEARRLAASLRECRDRKQWGPPDTFDRTASDPKGTGLGIYLAVWIGVKRDPPGVVLRHDPTFSVSPGDRSPKPTKRRGFLARLVGARA